MLIKSSLCRRFTLLVAVGGTACLLAGCGESDAYKKKMEALEAKHARIDRLNAQPLMVTESSNLSDDFTITFCTNQHLGWKTARLNSDVRWSYDFKLVNGKVVADSDLNLDVLDYGKGLSAYQKSNNDSRWCYRIVPYYQLRNIPTMQYQKGYNTRSKPEMHKREVKERQDFRASIKEVTITFSDKDGVELLTFSTTP